MTTFAKTVIFGLADCFEPENIFSAYKVGKSRHKFLYISVFSFYMHKTQVVLYRVSYVSRILPAFHKGGSSHIGHCQACIQSKSISS